MTENTAAKEPDLAPVLNPGAVLTAARESQRMTQQEVAEQLNLRVDVIKALESGDYDDLPGETFVRGYLRGYARLLDVDEEDIIEPREYEAHTTVTNGSIRTRGARPRVHRGRSRGKSRFGLVFLALIVLIVATWTLSDIPNLGIGGWLAGFGKNAETTNSDDAVVGSGQFPVQVNITRLETPSQEPEKPAGKPVADDDQRQQSPGTNTGSGAVSGAATTPVVDGGATVAVVATPAQTVSTGEVPNSSASGETEPYAAQPISLTSPTAGTAVTPEATPPTEPAQPSAPAPPSGSHSLVVTTSDASWVDIRDATGKQLAYGTLNANEIRQLVGIVPFRLVLGNASGVKIQLDGTSMDPSAFVKSDRTARFSVNADGVFAN